MEPSLNFTFCDACHEQFTAQKIPLTLVNCGHTFCKTCINQNIETVHSSKVCPECNEATPLDQIRPNKKVLKYLQTREVNKTLADQQTLLDQSCRTTKEQTLTSEMLFGSLGMNK